MDFNFLSQKYATQDLDLTQALRIWRENRLSPENIRDQIRYDTGVRINSADAKMLYKLGSEVEKGDKKLEEFGMAKGNENNDPFYGVNYANQNKNYGGMEAVAKDFAVSKGREDLLPDNIRNQNRIKFTPSIRRAFERVSEHVYRDKYAAKYWTLKEKIGEDGKKAVYLVAIETDDNVKTAGIRRADAPAGTVGAPGQTVQPGVQATPTDQGLQQTAPGSNPGVPGNPPAGTSGDTASPVSTPEAQAQQAMTPEQAAAAIASADIPTLGNSILQNLGSRAKEVIDYINGLYGQKAAQPAAVAPTEAPTGTEVPPATAPGV